MNQSTDFEQQFLEFQDQLKSYLYRLVPNQQDLEDLAQETYIRAFKKLDTFEGRSSFKTWVFAIATNLARDFLRAQKRWGVDYQDNCRTATYASKEIQAEMFAITQQSPHGKFVLKEHIDYCFTCMSKTLPLDHQVCLILKEVYGFKNAEIAEITGLSFDRAKHAVAGGRKQMRNIFDGRCTLISKEGMCHQCTELNGMFNPKQDQQEELMKIKMVKEREKADYETLFDLRLKLVKSIDPLNCEGFDFHNYMLENLPSHSE